MYGKMEIGLIFFNCFVNLLVIILDSVDKNKRIVVYIYKIINRKWE